MIKQREANSWKSVSYAKAITGAQTYTKFPIVLRTTQQSIPTWNVKANTETSGTPSPSSPITINGVGERTANLFDWSLFSSTYPDNASFINGVFDVSTPNTTMFTTGVSVNIPADTTFSCTAIAKVGQAVNGRIKFVFNDNTYIDVKITNEYGEIINNIQRSFSKAIVSIRLDWSTFNNGFSFKLAMLNSGSRALPYEPFGYKIPLSSNGTALTPMYLSNQLMKIGDTVDSLASSGTVTYNVKKVIFTGEETWTIAEKTSSNRFATSPLISDGDPTTVMMSTHLTWGGFNANDGQDGTVSGTSGGIFRMYLWRSLTLENFVQWLKDEYAAGTPVTVYYVLATPTTETVTAPSITTTSGLNTIDVNTTVKPSEISLTYNGWRINKQKRKSANLYNHITNTSGYRIKWATGEPYADDSAIMSDYIPVSIGTYSLNKNTLVVGYDSAKNYIGVYVDDEWKKESTSTTINSFTVTEISNVSWVRLMSYNGYYSLDNTVMLNAGSTALPYAPYWE